MALDWPLMINNITEEDLDEVIRFLKKNPILTQSTNVVEFEREWSKWLGVKYSVFVLPICLESFSCPSPATI